jgi:putative SOS response-associated peptidase YedK
LKGPRAPTHREQLTLALAGGHLAKVCNLYRLKGHIEEVAGLFNAQASPGANFGEEVYPGYPGVVVAEGVARTMTWGFPLRLKSMKPTSKPKAVNNARDDKLMTPMWKASFQQRRCLIPVTQWAEAEGPERKKTRTWYSLHGADLFAVAGIWRSSDEWGDVYSIVMVDGCAQMSDVHDRMPVILRPENYAQWTDGTPGDAMALVRTCDHTLAVDRTTELWFTKRKPTSGVLL